MFPDDAKQVERAWSEAYLASQDGVSVAASAHPATTAEEDEARDALLAHFAPDFNRVSRQMERIAARVGVDFPSRVRHGLIEQVLHPLVYELYARACAAVYLGGAWDGCFLETTRCHGDALKAEVLRIYPQVGARYREYARGLVTSVRTLLSRFAADRHAISTLCNEDLLPDVVSATPLGEAHGHAGASTCLAVRTAAGSVCQVMYKPRDLRIDAAFHAIAQDMAGRATWDMRTPRFLLRDGYGWMEYVPERPCEQADDVSAYYSRLGWLTALVHALNGRDIHAGNVIAQGQYPLLVDLECLLTPATNETVTRTAPKADVTATGMVPMPRFNLDTYAGLDSSAFSGGEGGAHFYRDWRLVDVNTSTPRVVRVPKVLGRQRNLPVLERARVNPHLFGPDYLRGFEAGYRQILKEREALLSGESALASMADVEVRVVLRNTGEYLKVLYEGTAPCLLTSRQKTTDYYRSALPASQHGVAEAEVAALLQGVVPRFSCLSSGGGLFCEHASGALQLRLSGYELARQRFRDVLGEGDLQEQLKLLRHCLGCMRLNDARFAVLPPSTSFDSEADPLELAIRAMHLIEGRRLGSNVPEWHGCEVSRAGTLVATRMPWGLCTGRAGVLAAYASMYRLTGDPSYRHVVAGGIAHLYSLDPRSPQLSGSGLNGLASLLYLYTCAQLWCGLPINGAARATLLQHLRESNIVGGVGLQSSAGDLALLLATWRLCNDADVQSVAMDIASRMVTSATLAPVLAVEHYQSRAQPAVGARLHASLVCLHRHAVTFGDDELATRCMQLNGGAGQLHDNLHGLLLHARMILDSAACVTTPEVTADLCDRLMRHAHCASLGSQYGLGALLDTVAKLEGSKSRRNKDIVGLYMSRAQTAIELASSPHHPSTSFLDLSRGYAGVVLRLSFVHDRTLWPSPLLF